MTQYSFNVNSQSVVGNLTWNPLGTLASLAVTDPFNSGDAQTCSYSHDDLSRIASANCGSVWSQTFSYDAFGNINKSGSSSFGATYSSSTNQMTLIGSSTPSYDSNGNVTNDFLNTYAWDANSRPVTADSVGLTFDALGRMVEQNRSGTYTEIAYAPDGAKLALMSGSTLQKGLISLTGGSMAVYNSSGLAYYRHPDWIGSSRFASTPSRTMYSDGAYGPFGEPYAQTGTADASFTGMNQDTAANMYDFPAREYGTQGRWPSPDPAGLSSVHIADPQTWSRYAYVRNNPLALVDPTGMDSNDPCEGDGDPTPPDGPQEAFIGHGDAPADDDGCGGSGGSGGGSPPIISQSNPPTCWGITCDGPPPPPGPPSGNPSPGGGPRGGGSGGAPSPTILHCLVSGNELKADAATALDVIGAIPLAGNIAHGIQLAAGIVSAGMSISGSFTNAAVAGGSLGLSIADAEKLTTNIAVHGTEIVPVLGNIVSGASAVNDFFGKEGVISSFKACRNGTNGTN